MGKLMVYGATSSAGKSLITTGLLRILTNRGYETAPFKSQNMSRKYAYTRDEKLISTAQVVQAYACKKEADVRMNPLLLVPASDTGSDVYLLGELQGHMEAKDYFLYKKDMGNQIQEIFESLYRENDHIVIEGAGSPAEINLMENDIVNTGMANLADSNAILVVDIDRGGAFAHLYGTYFILNEEDRKRIKGFVINKFRGDVDLLKSGIEKIQDLTGVDVLGVLPYGSYDLPDEDSLVDSKNKLEIDQMSKKQIDLNIDKLARDMEKYLDIEKILEIMS